MPDDVTASELARRVGVDPKILRAWLRAEWRDGHRLLRGHVLHARWLFSEADAGTLAAEFAGRS
jgi:transposase-like protein